MPQWLKRKGATKVPCEVTVHVDRLFIPPDNKAEHWACAGLLDYDDDGSPMLVAALERGKKCTATAPVRWDVSEAQCVWDESIFTRATLYCEKSGRFQPKAYTIAIRPLASSAGGDDDDSASGVACFDIDLADIANDESGLLVLRRNSADGFCIAASVTVKSLASKGAIAAKGAKGGKPQGVIGPSAGLQTEQVRPAALVADVGAGRAVKDAFPAARQLAWPKPQTCVSADAGNANPDDSGADSDDMDQLLNSMAITGIDDASHPVGCSDQVCGAVSEGDQGDATAGDVGGRERDMATPESAADNDDSASASAAAENERQPGPRRFCRGSNGFGAGANIPDGTIPQASESVSTTEAAPMQSPAVSAANPFNVVVDNPAAGSDLTGSTSTDTRSTEETSRSRGPRRFGAGAGYANAANTTAPSSAPSPTAAAPARQVSAANPFGAGAQANTHTQAQAQRRTSASNPFGPAPAAGAQAQGHVQRGAEEQQLLCEAEANAKRENVEQAQHKLKEQAQRKKAEEQVQREVEEHARRAAKEQAQREAGEQAQREAEEQAQREAEEQAQREAEAKTQCANAEQAQREADEEAQREADEEAQREADEEAQREADEEAQREADDKAQREADDKAHREADEQAQREAEAQRRAEEQARHKVEEQAQRAQHDEEAQTADPSLKPKPQQEEIKEAGRHGAQGQATTTEQYGVTAAGVQRRASRNNILSRFSDSESDGCAEQADVANAAAFDSFEVSFGDGPLGLAFGLRAGEPYEKTANSLHDTSLELGSVALATCLLAGRIVVHHATAQARAKGVQAGDVVAAVGAIEYFDTNPASGSSGSEHHQSKPRPTQHDVSQAILSGPRPLTIRFIRYRQLRSVVHQLSGFSCDEVPGLQLNCHSEEKDHFLFDNGYEDDEGDIGDRNDESKPSLTRGQWERERAELQRELQHIRTCLSEHLAKREQPSDALEAAREAQAAAAIEASRAAQAAHAAHAVTKDELQRRIAELAQERERASEAEAALQAQLVKQQEQANATRARMQARIASLQVDLDSARACPRVDAGAVAAASHQRQPAPAAISAQENGLGGDDDDNDQIMHQLIAAKLALAQARADHDEVLRVQRQEAAQYAEIEGQYVQLKLAHAEASVQQEDLQAELDLERQRAAELSAQLKALRAERE